MSAPAPCPTTLSPPATQAAADAAAEAAPAAEFAQVRAWVDEHTAVLFDVHSA